MEKVGVTRRIPVSFNSGPSDVIGRWEDEGARFRGWVNGSTKFRLLLNGEHCRLVGKSSAQGEGEG